MVDHGFEFWITVICANSQHRDLMKVLFVIDSSCRISQSERNLEAVKRGTRQRDRQSTVPGGRSAQVFGL